MERAARQADRTETAYRLRYFIILAIKRAIIRTTVFHKLHHNRKYADCPSVSQDSQPEMAMGWVDPWVGLGWVQNFLFRMGWVGLG